LLCSAFFARQFWGAFADRYGGLKTVLAGSTLQAVSISAFLLTQNEAGLFVVRRCLRFRLFGHHPAYVVAVRDLFPLAEASWRVPLVLFTAMSGMAFGSWFAGLIYDHFSFYAPAFGSGVLFNLINLALVGFLVMRQSGRWRVTTVPWRADPLTRARHLTPVRLRLWIAQGGRAWEPSSRFK
jgi:MFS family permease